MKLTIFDLLIVGAVAQAKVTALVEAATATAAATAGGAVIVDGTGSATVDAAATVTNTSSTAAVVATATTVPTPAPATPAPTPESTLTPTPVVVVPTAHTKVIVAPTPAPTKVLKAPAPSKKSIKLVVEEKLTCDAVLDSYGSFGIDCTIHGDRLHKNLLTREISTHRNGEIYNHMLIRQEHLQEYNIESHSNSIVPVYLFRKYGAQKAKEWIQYLDDIFACVIYDERQHAFIAFRDHNGSKKKWEDGKVISCVEVEEDKDGFCVSLLHFPASVKCEYFTNVDSFLSEQIPQQTSHVFLFASINQRNPLGGIYSREGVKRLRNQYACTGGLCNFITYAPPRCKECKNHQIINANDFLLVFVGEGLLRQAYQFDGYQRGSEMYQICSVEQITYEIVGECYLVNTVQQVVVFDEENQQMEVVGPILSGQQFLANPSRWPYAILRTSNNQQKLLDLVWDDKNKAGDFVPCCKVEIEKGDLIFFMESNQQLSKLHVHQTFDKMQSYFKDQNLRCKQEFGNQNDRKVAWGTMAYICNDRGSAAYQESQVQSKIFVDKFEKEENMPGLVGFFAEETIGPIAPVGMAGWDDPYDWECDDSRSDYTLIGFKQ